MFINILIFILALTGFIMLRNWDHPMVEDISSNKRYLKPFIPLSSFIYDKLALGKKGVHERSKMQQMLDAIYINQESDYIYKRFVCEKIAFILLILLFFNGLSLLAEIRPAKDGTLIDGKYIDRPAYGEGSKDYELTVGVGNEDFELESELSFQLDEQRYEPQMLIQKIEEAKEYIIANLLSNNESLDNINNSLHLIKGISDMGMRVEWDTGDSGLIDTDGTVHNSEVQESGVLTTIKAIIRYYDTSAEYPITIRIMPSEKELSEQIIRFLEDAIKSNSTSNITNKRIELPESLELPQVLGKSDVRYDVKYKDVKDMTGWLLILLGFIISILAFVGADKNIESQLKIRNKELIMDYPEFVNKITLLLSAGLTIKGVWERITQEYQARKKDGTRVKRYLYEEMTITLNEIYNGRGEGEAFIAFGNRIKLLPYVKLSTLLEQNRRKGTKGLIELLEYEGTEAFEERKELAKRMGEEAGTKLLAPMMLMLIIVLMIIMVPAFMVF